MVSEPKKETQEYERRKDLPTKHSVRPWGMVTLLVRNQKCSVDWTMVNPGHITSLHSHNIREELWVMLDGGAEVIVGDEVLHPKVGDKILMKTGVKHRLVNNTDHSIRMIVICFGDWREEDQIRHEDAYGREGEPVKL